jgi:NDP-sugar pyrophosphorylase family protein
MWWKQLQKNAESLLEDPKSNIDHSATIAKTAVLAGKVSIGRNSKICAGAFIQGPVQIGDNCLIGNNTMIRGPLTIGDGAKIGFGVEIKNAVIGNKVAIGPSCYVADSVLDDGVYLGAMVRTSNHRLDGCTVSVMHEGTLFDTGLEKLGCHIGTDAHLGIMDIILPGRIIAPGSLFGPRITIEKNLPPGRYTLKQELRLEALF